MKPAAQPPTVYRLSRRPDPWAWPDWSYADADGTFVNRFDVERVRSEGIEPPTF